jgi:hypothetical protein
VQRCRVAVTQVGVRQLDNPWFALRKRRPETYDELVARR